MLYFDPFAFYKIAADPSSLPSDFREEVAELLARMSPPVLGAFGAGVGAGVGGMVSRAATRRLQRRLINRLLGRRVLSRAPLAGAIIGGLLGAVPAAAFQPELARFFFSRLGGTQAV